MKMRRDHLVPLSNQAVEILRALNRMTGDGKFVFPSIRSDDRCMSENTVSAALRSMGYPKEVMTAHGFRAMAHDPR
jgi:integrase